MQNASLTRRDFSLAAAGVLAAAAFPLSACAQGEEAPQNASEESSTVIQKNEQATETDAQPAAAETTASILFINSSRNKEGNTAQMGEELLDGLDYEKLDLIDYKLHPLGQEAEDDQFTEVWRKMLAAPTIVIGTPVYWHTMASSLKILIDRMYEYQDGSLAGKQFAFFCQGGGPTEMSLENLTYTFERVSANYDMNLIGTASSRNDVASLRAQIDAALG